MNDRRRILVSSIFIMAGVVLCATATAITILYRTAFDEERANLLEIATGQARFMEAVARFDAVHSRDAHPNGSVAATLSQIADAYEHYQGFGKTGEFVIARRDGERIIFLLPYRHGDGSDPDPVPWLSELAGPMRLALSGEEGTTVGLDYRGEAVLAAYAPVAILDFGVVAKIDLAEVRAPFVMAGAATCGVTFLLVVLGTGLVLRVCGPLTRRLETSEARTRAIVETAADGIVTTDECGSIKSFNPAAERMFGYPADEVIGKVLNLVLTPVDGENRDDVLTSCAGACCDRKSSTCCEAVGWRKDGTSFPVDLSLSEMRLGKTRKFSVIMRDISERKQGAEAQGKSEERLRLTLDAVSDGGWDWNVPTGEVHYSDPWLESLGYKRDEVPPHISFWESIVHPDDLPHTKEVLNAHLHGRTPHYESENRLRASSGEYRWNLDRGRVVARDDAGKPLRMVGTDTDITERKQAAEALRESERRFQLLYEDAPLGYQSLDTNGMMLTVNRAWLDLLGYAQEEVHGRWFGDFLTPSSQDAFRERFPRFKEKGETRGAEFEMQCKDGSTITVAIDGQVSRDEEGRFKQTHCILHDITERKRAEVELASTVAELQQFDRLTVGREERMIELKREVNEMARKAGLAPPYDTALVEAGGPGDV